MALPAFLNKSGKKGTVANNMPVGSAGQPDNGKVALNKSRMDAIQRRMQKNKGDKK